MNESRHPQLKELNKSILKLAGPNIISNISIPLLGIVDMTLMGHLPSDSYIGAIALGSLIFNFIYWSLGFLRMGTSGFTAQAFGRGDQAESILVFARAALIALSFSLILLLVQRPLELFSFAILKGESEVEALAMEYFRIRIWAAPASLGQFALLGFFLGMQNARYPMIILVASNLINLAANYFFVMVLHMESNGVALGTVIAQYSGLLIGVVLLVKKYAHLFNYFSGKALLEWTKFKKFLHVNRDIFIRTMCLVIVFSFFTASSASADVNNPEDETILAVNSLLMQFFMFFSFLIDGFAHAAEALAGRYIGAKDSNSLRLSTKLIFTWGAGIVVFFTLLYLFAGNFLFSLLTNNTEVIQNAKPYFAWLVSIPLLSFVAFVWDGIFIGATAGKEMRNAMLISSLLVFFPVYYFAEGYMGNHGLWLAFVLFMTARGITMTIMSKKVLQKASL